MILDNNKLTVIHSFYFYLRFAVIQFQSFFFAFFYHHHREPQRDRMRDSIAIHITYAGIASRKLLGCIHFFCTHLPVRCMFLVGIFDYMVPHVEHYMVIHSSPYDAAPSPFILFLFYTSTRRAHRLWKGLSIQLFIDLFHSISINWSGPLASESMVFIRVFFSNITLDLCESVQFFSWMRLSITRKNHW